MELTEDIMEQIVPGCYVRLRSRTESEITRTQGNKINTLYKIAYKRVGRVISINKARLGQADVVFDHMDHISRVDTKYLEWLCMDDHYSNVAPGDYLTFSSGRKYKVLHLVICEYISLPGYYVIYECDYSARIPYTFTLKENNVTPGERNVVDYTEDNLSKFIDACLGDIQNNHILPSSVAKDILNSYYGMHSFKDREPTECKCSKSNAIGYGFRHATIYSEPFTIDKNETDKMCSIDTFDIIKEMQKMKKFIKKPVTNPIEKVIFNPPATIVFWKDGSKTVVKAQGDVFNPETGLAMAISRHYLCDVCGLERYDGVFNRYLPKDKV